MEPVLSIVECPAGSNHKYTYEPDSKYFKLSKIMPAGLVFPFDFGFIPDTEGDDGDPLDIIIISEIKSFPGCAMDCRIIGSIKAEQTEDDGSTMRNDRYLAIPEVSQLFKEVNDVKNLPEGIIVQVENFFKNYNAQAGKKFKVLECVGAEDAYNSIEKQRK